MTDAVRIRELWEERGRLDARRVQVDAELRALLGADATEDAATSCVPLTDRQRMVMICIETALVKSGFPPSVRELGEQTGIRSTNGVHGFLRALERKGWISRVHNRSRSIRVLRSARTA